DVRLQVPMLKSKHFSRATESGLDFIRDQQRPIFPAKFLRANKEIGLGSLTAFPLDGLNHQCRHIARTQLAIQRLDIIEWHTRIKSLHQRAEAFSETFASHQR